MQPLHDFLLLEQFDVAKEEKNHSGIILLNNPFNLSNFDDEETRIKSIVRKQKHNMGKVFRCGNKCSFVSEGDTVVYQKFCETRFLEIEGRKCVLVKEKAVLSKDVGESIQAAPGHVIVKIRREDEDAIYKKKIKRDDGTWCDLFLTVKVDAIDERRNELFVSCGEIVSVGEGVENVQVGDLGIVDYVVDNDDTIIVGYDGEDKLIAITAKTTYEPKDNIVPANRKNNKDTVVARKGDFDIISQLFGVIRGEELISIAPYIFLAHETNMVMKERGAIQYVEKETIFQRKVLSVPGESIVHPRIHKGDTVLVKDADVCEVKLRDGKVQCIADQDVLAII